MVAWPFVADQFQIRFLLGFSLATFTEKSCEFSYVERGRLIYIAATQSGIFFVCFFVNKLRAVNTKLSKFKLIDGGRQNVSVTETGVGPD